MGKDEIDYDEIEAAIPDSQTQDIYSPTEKAEALKTLNDDSKIEGYTNIDFNTRLPGIKIDSIIMFDLMVKNEIIPDDMDITRHIKRLCVSEDGMGRAEAVKILSPQPDDMPVKQRGMVAKLFGIGARR